MRFWIKISLLLLILSGLVACKQKENKGEKWNKQKSEEWGKKIAQDEDIQIKLYMDQHSKYHFTPTGSGLQIAFVKHGDGEPAKSGMIAEVCFKMWLLDGTLCYQSDLDQTEDFKIDHEDIESGIQEGIKLMHVGDKCRFIIPSHLAHGLLGDFEKIPPLSVIIVDVELVGLRK